MDPFRASALSPFRASPRTLQPLPLIALSLHQSRFHSIPLSRYPSIPSAAPVAAAADVDVAADALAADPAALSEPAAPAADAAAAAPAPDAGPGLARARAPRALAPFLSRTRLGRLSIRLAKCMPYNSNSADRSSSSSAPVHQACNTH
eukprot:3486268-Pyramimonas_sp.AAC.1